jgi:hypothetical protein
MIVDTKVGEGPAAELFPIVGSRSSAQAASVPTTHSESSNAKPRTHVTRLCRNTAGNFIMSMPV